METSYTYENSGFNNFMSRSLDATGGVTLRAITATMPRREINFDHFQTSGNLGDKVQVGGINLDGANRRIVIKDENGVEIGYFGELDG